LRRLGRLIVRIATAPCELRSIIVSSLQLGAISVQKQTNVFALDIPDGNIFIDSKYSGMAYGMPIAEALRRDPSRRHRLVLCRQAASGNQQRLAALRNKTLIGDLVVIVEQPRQTGLIATMQLDRPG